MLVYDKCKNCQLKATTFGCINCKWYSIQHSIQELDELISSESDLTHFIFYFNEIYYDILKSVLNLDLMPYKVITPNMEDKHICIIIDKNKLDWGEFNIKYNREDD